MDLLTSSVRSQPSVKCDIAHNPFSGRLPRCGHKQDPSSLLSQSLTRPLRKGT